MKTSLFDFELPPECIAAEPVSPRDASRMLIVQPGGRLTDDHTCNFTSYLRAGDVVVFNDTRVIPARLTGKRGEAQIEVTLLKKIGLKTWSAFARPAKKLEVGDNVIFADDFLADVTNKHEGGLVELLFNESEIYSKLNKYGEMPLPPYMKRKSQTSDNTNYQTIYASKDGAVAAPTAGLHFTKDMLESIDKSGAKRVYVTLHVGAGTFQPVKAEDTGEHIMHSEYAEISAEVVNMLNQCRKSGGRIIAIGTTSLRVLESATDETGVVQPYAGETDIFITPGYKFKAVDALMTNFHLPRSTLFMLVSAFMGLEVMKEAYNHAIEAQYRFYSYGDACFLAK